MRSTYTLMVAVVTNLLCSASLSVEAREARFSGSGWSMNSAEADVDSSMSGGSSGHSAGRGTFGPFTAGATSDLADWDGVSLCDFDPETGTPRGVELTYLTFSQVVRFARGDLLFLQMNPSPPSTLCFNFVDNRTFSFELHLDVAGGTGRFAAAEGRLVSRGTGSNLSEVLSAFEAMTAGEIRLNQ